MYIYTSPIKTMSPLYKTRIHKRALYTYHKGAPPLHTRNKIHIYIYIYIYKPYENNEPCV